jgi:hypothetical protein
MPTPAPALPSEELCFFVDANSNGDNDGKTRQTPIPSLAAVYKLAVNDPVRKTVVVLGNIDTTGPIMLDTGIGQGKEPVLIVGDTGKKIIVTRQDAVNGSVIEISGGAKVTFRNMKIDGAIVPQPIDKVYNRALSVSNKGTEVTLDVGTVITGVIKTPNGGTKEGGSGITVFDDAALVMNTGSAVTDCVGFEKGRGSIFVVDEASLTINGGEIYGNATEAGGGIYVIKATATMNGGVISGNKAEKGAGGGVYHTDTRSRISEFNVGGGVVYGRGTASSLKNTAPRREGSAVYFYDETAANPGKARPLVLENTVVDNEIRRIFTDEAAKNGSDKQSLAAAVYRNFSYTGYAEANFPNAIVRTYGTWEKCADALFAGEALALQPVALAGFTSLCTAKNTIYSASACKILTDTGCFFKTLFGRISAAMRRKPGFAGIPPQSMAYGSAPWPMAACGGPAPPIPCANPGTPRGGHNPNDRQLSHRF